MIVKTIAKYNEHKKLKAGNMDIGGCSATRFIWEIQSSRIFPDLRI